MAAVRQGSSATLPGAWMPHREVEEGGEMKRYIVWTNYGLEGWKPTEFDSLKDASTYIRAGSTQGFPFEVTEHIELLCGEYL